MPLGFDGTLKQLAKRREPGDRCAIASTWFRAGLARTPHQRRAMTG